MPAYLRSLSLILGITLGIFLSVGGWYWLLFKRPAPDQIEALNRHLPTLVALIDSHRDTEAAALLDQLPYRIVVSNSDRQAITSNLSQELRQRQIQGQRALNNGLLTEHLDQSGLRFYYQLPVSLWDVHLLFPLILGLLLGLLAALWDLWQRQQLQEQTEALIMISQPPAPQDPALQARLTSLESENQALKNATRPPPAASEDRHSRQALETELAQLRQQQQKQEEILRQQAHSLADLQAELTHQQERLSQRDKSLQESKTALEDTENQLTKALQTSERLQNKLTEAEARLSDIQSQSDQLHAAWQEIQQLRSAETGWLQKQEGWQRDRRNLLTQLQEKEVQRQKIEASLQQSRLKLREISAAYKKQLETLQHLPPDLQDLQGVLAGLIEEKDLIEHENAELRIELADRASESQRLRKELEIRSERLQQAQQMIDSLGQALQKNERELGLLSETLADKLQDLERVQDLHDEDQRALASAIQERDQLRLQLAEQEDSLAQLRDELSDSQAAHQALQQKLDELDIEQLTQERDHLRQSLQLMTQQQERRQQSLDSLKEKLKTGEALYDKLKRHAEKQALQLQAQVHEIQRYRSELQLLKGRDEAIDSLSEGS
ncbi:MAG: hypothetical protein IGS03_08710 [Candidatus Sericytochromatia bacterium]|nr:hypothetical protein [Candidatus Sericytochromatia bacterium]